MNVTPDYRLLAEIKAHFEGYREVAYKDSGGVWTIGTGHTYNYDKGRKVRSDDVIDQFVNQRWTKLAVEGFVAQANRYIKKKLTGYQSAAIVDYIYNRGIGNFLKTNLDELINANPYDKKILDELVGTGLRDKAGNLLWGLGRRRRAQAFMYHTGGLKFDWPRWGIFKVC